MPPGYSEKTPVTAFSWHTKVHLVAINLMFQHMSGTWVAQPVFYMFLS